MMMSTQWTLPLALTVLLVLTVGFVMLVVADHSGRLSFQNLSPLHLESTATFDRSGVCYGSYC